MATWLGTSGDDTYELLSSEISGIMFGGLGNDTLSGVIIPSEPISSYYNFFIYGDQLEAGVHSYDNFGDDVLSGSPRPAGYSGHIGNYVQGDASYLFEGAVVGNDRLIGGQGTTNMLWGDASTMFAGSRGGDDQLYGGDGGYNVFHGDAYVMHSGAVGGSDILIAGAGTHNMLYGDADRLGGRGGNDRLVSDSGNDEMYGDGRLLGDLAEGGNDVFVFRSGNGQDTIHDFRPGEDLIDLQDFWVNRDSVTNTFKGSETAWSNFPAHVQAKFLEVGPPVMDKIGFADLVIESSEAASVLRFADGGSVIIHGTTELSESDFIFL